MIYWQLGFVLFFCYWFIGNYSLKSSQQLYFVTPKLILFNYKVLLVELFLFIFSYCCYLISETGLILEAEKTIILLKLVFFTNIGIGIICLWFIYKDNGVTFSYPIFNLLYGKTKSEEILNTLEKVNRR